MADAQANIGIGIDTTAALASIRQLQREISAFHTLMAKGNATVAGETLRMRQGLINSINETGKFSAKMTNIASTTESFTNALEKNKFSMGQYFRYAGASTKTFGKLFTREFDTINRVATERVKDLQTQYISMGRDANGALQAIKVRPLALDMDNLGTRTMLAAQKQQLFNQLLKQGSTNLLNFGKNTQWAGRQLMVGFTIPLAIFGTAAAREFQKLEEQAIRFKRVYGDMFTTSGETERALENVKQLATEFTKYGIALEETVGLAAKVAQMGNMGAAMEAQVRQATRLSVLGGIEQQEALDTTISLTNAFGIATEDLADKINFLNAAENQTILSIEDFNEAIPKAGSVVRALGGDVEDLAFFLTAMREGGINASQGANALKSSLGRLINPSEEARKRLANMGIDVVGIVNANAGNLRGTIMALAVELDKLSSLERSRAIEQLFGKFQFARMSTMLTNIATEGSQANRVLQLTGNSVQELGIIAERELGRVENSVAYKFQKSLEEFKASLAPLGGEFLKAVTPLVEFGTKVLNKFNEMGDGAKQFIVIMSAVLGAIGPVALMSFGLLANGVANLIKMFAGLGIFYQRLSGQGKSLGLSTQYMTQEQIEAAAVAASLSQSHAQLTQVFGLEATALAKLTAAYQSATAAQRTFNAGAAARRASAPSAKGVGLSSGTLSVPGPKGAGDVVPAMLSPGEAVIPAKQAQKYSGFISSIMQDKVPGFRFGLNPFKNMFERSRVGVRMQSTDFMSAARSGDTRYKTGFETKTGDDFTMSRLGRPEARDPRKVKTRELTEDMFFGVKPNAPYSQRPTYGFVAQDSIMARLLNLVLGKRGAGFNKKTNPMNPALDQYGDISLITRRSVGKRSEVSDKDALVFFRNLHMSYGGRNAEGLKDTIARFRSNPDSALMQRQPDLGLLKNTPLYGGNTAALDTTQRQNSYYNYLETYTKGGFKFKEIERIIAKDAQTKRLLQKELREAGLSGIRVTSPGFISKLFKSLGVPGFADGILSIPGPKGAGDVVPAMLSPGEAVIPAKQAQRHAPMINDMIRGRIPGYEEGVEVKEKTGQRRTTAAPKAPAGSFMGYSNAVMLLSPGGKGDNSLLNSRAGVDPQGLSQRIKSGGAALQAPLADSLARGLLGSRPTQKAIADKISKTPEIKTFAAGVNDGIAKGVAGWGKKNPGMGMTDKQFYQIADKAVATELNKKQGGANKYSADFKKSVRSQVLNPTMYQDTTNKRVRQGKNGGFFLGDPGRDKLFASGKSLSYRRDFSGSIGALGGDPAKLGTYARAHFVAPKPIGLGSIPKDQLSGPARASLARSQAGTTRIRVGEAAGTFKAGAVNTVNKALTALGLSINKNNDIVDKNNKVVKSGSVQSKKTTSVTKKSTEATKKSTTATKKDTEEKTKGTAQQKKSNRAVAANTDRVVANTKAGEVIARKAASGKDRFYTRSADGRLTRMSESEATRAANRSAGARQAAQTKAANRTPAPTPEPKAGEAAAKSRLGGPGAVIGGIAGLGMLGAMGASFAPGKVGEVAQQLLFPLMMLPMILPLLKNPIVLALAAVAALGGSIYLLHRQLTEASKAGVDASQAMSMTAEKVKSISEITGTVGATEIRQRANESMLSPTGNQFSSFGIDFVQDSDQGKAMLEDIERQFNSGRMVDEVGENMGRQLAQAIASGVLSVDQARSIASALGSELGDYTFGLNVSGKLTELLGVDGSDLLKDPLTVVLRIKEDTMKEQADSFEQALGALDFESAWGLSIANTQDSALAKWGEGLKTAGAAGVAAAGLATVVTAGAATPATALAAGVSALSYGAGVVVSTVAKSAENNELAAAALQLGVEGLAQNQSLLDSLNYQYDTMIAQAETQEEINRLEEERRERVAEFNAENAAATASILEQAKALDDIDLYSSAIKESVNQRYSEGPMKTFATEALKRTSELEDTDFAISLDLQMATGELSPIAVLRLIELGQNNETFQTNFDFVMRTQGTAQTNQLVQLLTQNKLSDEAYTILFNFVSTQEDPIAFQNNLDALAAIASAEARYGIDVNLETNGIETLQAVTEELEKYETLPEEMTKEAFVDIAANDEKLAVIVALWDSLGLTENISRQFVLDYIINTYGGTGMTSEDVAEEGDLESISPYSRRGITYTSQRTNEAAARRTAQQIPVTTPYEEPEDDGEPDPEGSGAAPKVDSLIQKLKQLRLATLQLRSGWDGMNQSIQDFLNAGNVGFNGLANQMRRFNVSEGLIERITGMDPDEYEKRKNELFIFDAAGNIVGTTAKLQNMGAAMNALALGEYVNSQQAFIENTNNQFTAMQTLTAEGLSFVEAYEMVQDQAIATAIAMGITKEQTAELIRITQMMTEMREKYDRVSEEEQAAKAVKQTNKEFNNRVAVLNKLSSQQGKYTDEEISAILNDSNLSTLFLNPQIDSKELSRALENARRAADLELQIKVTTEEGKKGLFDELIGEVQNEFNRQEVKIDVDFRLATKDDQKIVSEAQNKIAAIQYQVDDYEAQLKGIEDQEEVINEKYDERYKALEQVAAANERINRIRSAELNVADALSRGDIAAAARAQQELRATEAKNRAEEQKEMLQRQKEAELARVRSESGVSRQELEDKIKSLQDEIFGIEEESLEPAQERLRIAEYEKQLQVDALEVSGKTRDVWDQIASSTDIATQNTEEFAKNVERALALYEHFVNGAELATDLFGGELKAEAVKMGATFKESPPPPPPPPPPKPTNTGDPYAGRNIGYGHLNDKQREELGLGFPSSGTVIDARPQHPPVTVFPSNPNTHPVYKPAYMPATKTSPARVIQHSPQTTGLIPSPQQKGVSYITNTSSLSNAALASNIARDDRMAARYAPKAPAPKKPFSIWDSSTWNSGGMIIPKRMNVGGNVKGYAAGGFSSLGSDNVPAMLTPGEFVIRKRAVQDFGVKNLESINNGEYSGGSVYNYSLAVNVKSDADADKIAKTVMREIKRVDAQRVRGNRV
jgi:TP901 family phage tail tape measure protein